MDITRTNRLIRSASNAHASYPRTSSVRGLLDFKKQAERILNEARQQADEIRQAGFEEGFRQGFEEGRKEGLSRVSTIFHLVESMARARETLATELAGELAKIALMAAEKVIEQQIEEKPEVIVELVKRLAKEIAERDCLRIVLNPADLEIIQTADIEFPKGCDLVADPSIEAGGCLVELEGETIDARLKTRIRQLWRAVDSARVH